MASTEARSARAGDAWGGFASMLVALPTAIAYGVAVWSVLGDPARGALYGVAGAVALGIVAPIVGGSPRLISSPCGPAYVLLAALAADLLAGSRGAPPLPPEKVGALLAVVAVATGGLQLLYGILGGGRLIKYIPYPVVSGYLSGVGIYILWGQVPKLLGLPKGTGAWTGLRNPSAWSLPCLGIGAATAAAMVLGPRITRKVPGVVMGLAGGLLAYLGFALGDPALRTLEGNGLVIGSLGGGGAGELLSAAAGAWRSAKTLGLEDLDLALVPAVTLSVLLSIDTLKTCVVVDAMTRSRSDSNRVLRGQGAGNLLSALFGGMPGAGTMGGTLVNLTSGGTSRLSGILSGVLALAAFAALAGVIAWVPAAALAGILAVVSFRMIDRHSIDLLRNPNTVLDFLVVAAVVLTAVTTSMIAASGVGLALSILLFIREQIQVSVVHRKVRGDQVSSKRDRLPAERDYLRSRGAETVVCELQGTLFFGTTDQLLTILDEDLRTCRHLVLDLRRVQSMDYTAAHILDQIESTLRDRGARLHFTHLPGTLSSGKDLKGWLESMGLVSRERNVLVFDGMHEALEWIEDRVLAEAGLGSTGAEPPLALEEFDLFREFKADSLRILREAAEERRVLAGEKVFAQGEPGAGLLLIRKGTVHIRMPLEGGRHKHLATFARGSFFGDMAFLDRSPRSADAVAVEDTDLYLLSRDRFDALSHTHPRAGAMLFARLARILAERLRRTDAELRAREEA
ncbi:MAG: cyclic nucleotide-binding domain-containing protein [Planctomycetes bacterium]|nr:cyclic nucleotide-binding domain-containing protein [Planctomycetota bacterium]